MIIIAGYENNREQKQKSNSIGLHPKELNMKTLDLLNEDNLCMSQIIPFNPIIKDIDRNKEKYLKLLTDYLNIIGVSENRYVKGQLKAYETIICSKRPIKKHSFRYYYCYFLLDLLHIIGYEVNAISQEEISCLTKRLIQNFSCSLPEHNIVLKIIRAFKDNNMNALNTLKYNESLRCVRKYLDLICKNLLFKNKFPLKILVTANMSAGKSTFINALVGKEVSRYQNLACTSKIHKIINKPFEDGYSYEYDHDMVFTAGPEELLNDNPLNQTDELIVSTYFNGNFGNKKLTIIDTPGVNSSENAVHKEITKKIIESGDYDIVFYVMNATQLCTNDEEEHIEYIKKHIGCRPVVFVINKIDEFNSEKENIFDTINNLKGYLLKKNFKNIFLCPLSAKAGYFAKSFYLSADDDFEMQYELRSYLKRLTKLDLVGFYSKFYKNLRINDFKDKDKQLLKVSGLSFVEKMI